MYVHSLELEKVKCFNKLRFEFRRPDRSYAGWNVFVGGNASGKTTLLKVIALALSGDEYGLQLLKVPTGWISKGYKRGRAWAEVVYDPDLDLFTRGGRPPHNPFKCGVRWEQRNSCEPTFSKSLERTAKDSRITSASRGPWNPNSKGWFAAGYGPMRGLTGTSADAMRDALGIGPVPRFMSLFGEDVALGESEIWLKNLQFKALEQNEHARHLVEVVKTFLNDGLLPHGFSVNNIDSDHVYMRAPRGEIVPMRDMSDGYRCVYALMLDVIRNMVNVYGDTNVFETGSDGRIVVSKPGVLLIDELDTHLDLKWQRTISQWLKERFPEIQFFVTTQSPLIVQAADPGGIYFLPAPGENRLARRFEQQEYERIVLGRAEEVLLGEAFGLDHTRGVWALKQLDRYRVLAAKNKANALHAPPEKAEFQRLARQLEIEFEPDTGKNG